MKPRKTRGLPAKLEAVRRRFDRWRKAHRPRSRIPDALWSVAVKMAGRHGLHRTARALRLDYYSLKERLEPHAATDPKSAAGDAAGAFLELAGPSAVGPCACTVEWEDQAGAKMRLSLQGITTPDLAALSRSFWNRTS